MIDSKELRIGNWVYRQWNKMLKQADGERSQPDQIDKVMLQHSNMFDPIPINETMLLKCGFEKHAPNGMSMQDISVLLVNEKGHIEVYQSIFNEEYLVTTTISFPHVRYLHQLQNLYFSLKGEELNIEL